VLKNKSLDFEEINIEEQPEAREFVVSAGHRTMPQIYIDVKNLGVYTELLKYVDTL
jgi:glutaredoxin